MADYSSKQEERQAKLEIQHGIPAVSVVMPAYRCKDTITLAIDSALRQDVDLEILVIDDCSDDGLDQVMEKYAKDPSVMYIKNEKNLGAAASRNKGVAMARGEYIAFLDSDDWWSEGKLKEQIRRLEETRTILCCTGRELMTPEGELTGRVIPVKEIITYQDLLTHNSINCSSVLIRSEIMKQYQMEHEDSHEDYILWLKILKQYQKASGINKPYLKYRLSNSGKSGNKLKSAKMTYMAYRYSGYGTVASLWYFCNYACHGVWKYFMSRFGGTR